MLFRRSPSFRQLHELPRKTSTSALGGISLKMPQNAPKRAPAVVITTARSEPESGRRPRGSSGWAVGESAPCRRFLMAAPWVGDGRSLFAAVLADPDDDTATGRVRQQ